MFNPESLFKELEKVSNKIPIYILSAPSTPGRYRHQTSKAQTIQSSIKKLASKKLKERSQTTIKTSPQVKNSPKKPHCLELLRLYTKKPKIDLPQNLKLNTSRVVFSRPSSSKASNLNFPSRKDFKIHTTRAELSKPSPVKVPSPSFSSGSSLLNLNTLKVSVPQVKNN